MGIGRRQLLKTSALLTGAATINLAPDLSAKTSNSFSGEKVRNLLNQRLLNETQAQAVMEEYDLNGLIAINPVNVYYLTNTQTFAMRSDRPYQTAATLPRDSDQPTFLISSMADRWEVANKDHWTPEYITFSYPIIDPTADMSNPEFWTHQPQAGDFSYFVNEEADLTVREKQWIEFSKSHLPSPTFEWGIARALKESGIDRGRIAVDDMQIKDALAAIGIGEGIEFVDGDEIFRRIRYVKSPAEIELLRHSSTNNARAAIETAKSVQPGMTAGDLELIFNEKAGNHGNRMKFFLAGFPLGGFANSAVEEGESFLIDAVSGLHGYLGDFGRTVVLGEPDRRTRSIVAAQVAARESIFDILKPGVKYSEIRKTGLDAFKKSGENPRTFFVNPHSVGLQHTDQPSRKRDSRYEREDLVLKSGMTITVDLPYVEVGVGAGHNEEMLLITDTGFERMSELQDDIIIV